MPHETTEERETCGDPSEIECPTCGKKNDITGDEIDEGDEAVCRHCNAPFVVTCVDYDVTIYVKRK